MKKIIELYTQSIKEIPFLKYSWVLITTICILAIAAYFKLENTHVFYYAIAVIIICFISFVFSFILKNVKNPFIDFLLKSLITCIIVVFCGSVLGFGWFVFTNESPKFYKQLFPSTKDSSTSPIVTNQSPSKPSSFLLICRQKSTFKPIRKDVTKAGFELPITLQPVKAYRNLNDVYIPLVFGVPLAPGQVLFNIVYQNTGDQIEEKIRISVSFGDTNPTSIDKIKINNDQRMKIIEGGKQGASFVTFYIAEALPNEKQTAMLFISTQQFPTVTFWTSQSHYSKEVFIYDSIF